MLENVLRLLVQNVPAGIDLWIVPIMISMAVSLASPLWDIVLMLKRKDGLEILILLAVPFVIFGTIAIVEPLFMGCFFAAKTLIASTGIALILAEAPIYGECLMLVAVFLTVLALYTAMARRRLVSFRQHFGAQFVLLAGWELLLAAYVLGISLLALQGNFWLAGQSLWWSQVFLYSIMVLLRKGFLLAFTMVYTGLFGRYGTADGKKGGLAEQIRRKYLLLGTGIGLFALFFRQVVVLPLVAEGSSEALIYGFALPMLAVLVFITLYHLFFAAFPKRHESYRSFAAVPAEFVAKECRRPLYRDGQVMLTAHYLIERTRIFPWIIAKENISAVSAKGNRLYLFSPERSRPRRIVHQQAQALAAVVERWLNQ